AIYTLDAFEKVGNRQNPVAANQSSNLSPQGGKGKQIDEPQQPKEQPAGQYIGWRLRSAPINALEDFQRSIKWLYLSCCNGGRVQNCLASFRLTKAIQFRPVFSERRAACLPQKQAARQT